MASNQAKALNSSADLIQVFKIQKLDNILDQDDNLKEFALFLAEKSLASEHYLSVNMLHQTYLY